MPSWSARSETVELVLPCCNTALTRQVDFSEEGVVKRIQKIPSRCPNCRTVFEEEDMMDALKHQLHELVRDLKGGGSDEDEDDTDRFVMKHPDHITPYRDFRDIPGVQGGSDD